MRAWRTIALMLPLAAAAALALILLVPDGEPSGLQAPHAEPDGEVGVGGPAFDVRERPPAPPDAAPAEAPQPPPVSELVRDLRGDDEARRKAALSWCYRGLPYDLELARALVALEDIGNSMERGMAVRALHAMGPEVLPLLKPLVYDHEELTRAWAAAIMGWPRALPGSDGAGPLLADLLRDDKGRVRKAALKSCHVGPPEHPELVRSLCGLLESEYGDERLLAARGLGALGGAALDRILVLLDDPSDRMRRLAARALLSAPGEDLAARRQRLVALLARPEVEARVAGIDALGRIGKEAVGALEVLLARLREGTPTERTAVLRALSNMDGRAADAIPQLVALVETAGPAGAYLVVRALGRVGGKDPRARAALVRALEGPAWSEAAQALPAHGAAVIPALAGVLREGGDEAREGALYALEGLGAAGRTPTALAALLAVSGNGEDGLRAEALGLLAGFGARAGAAIPHAVADLENVDSENQDHPWAAARLLHACGAAGRRALVGLLASPRPAVRARALEGVRSLDEPTGSAYFDATEALRDDPDADVRLNVAYAIWTFADRDPQRQVRARAVLSALARGDPDRQVQAAADWVLGIIERNRTRQRAAVK